VSKDLIVEEMPLVDAPSTFNSLFRDETLAVRLAYLSVLVYLRMLYSSPDSKEMEQK
jgi:hypothetical protein